MAFMKNGGNSVLEDSSTVPYRTDTIFVPRVEFMKIFMVSKRPLRMTLEQLITLKTCYCLDV